MSAARTPAPAPVSPGRAAVYLWRRSLPAIWLGDGLGRTIASLV